MDLERWQKKKFIYLVHLTTKLIREEKCTAIMITHNMLDSTKYRDQVATLKDKKCFS